jgi:hypothetical protein
MPPKQKQKQKEYKAYSTKFPPQLPLADIRHVLGPDVFLEVLFPIGGKERRIFFFGERHGIEMDNECFKNPGSTVTFPGLINSLLVANPGKLLDLYVELPYRRSDRIFWADNNITQQTVINGFSAPPFGACLTFKKKDCPFPNLRAHYIDYRSTHALKGHDLALFLDLYRELKEYDELNQGLHKEYTWKGFQTALFDFVRTNPRLQKQYATIPPEVKTVVFSSIEKRMEEYLAFATELLDNKTRLEVFLGVVRFSIPALLMDLYGFGRMLREFVNAPSPNTLLVYTGFCHTEIYVSLLLKLGGSIVSQNRPVPTCDPRVEFSEAVFRGWNHCLPVTALGSLLS